MQGADHPIHSAERLGPILDDSGHLFLISSRPTVAWGGAGGGKKHPVCAAVDVDHLSRWDFMDGREVPSAVSPVPDWARPRSFGSGRPEDGFRFLRLKGKGMPGMGGGPSCEGRADYGACEVPLVVFRGEGN